MSLTNPNTPVSQKDLQDFYHRILPYLGGINESGSGHTIENAEGTDLTQRDTLQFGEGLSATDDPTNEKTVVDIDSMSAEDMDDIFDELPTGGNIAVTGYVPLGTLISFYGETAPKFFLACDGSVYNKADYPELANHLLSLTDNTSYIVDGDNTKFKVPDLRGEFLRGTGTNSHENQGSGGSVGEHQDGTEIPTIYCNIAGTSSIFVRHDTSSGKAPTNKDSSLNSTKKSSSGTLTSGADLASNIADRYTARPTNTSVLFCIAYKDIYSNPMNDYSTDEKVVGTWTDGKPIYQKTFTGTTSSDNTDTAITHGLPIDIGLVVNGYVISDSDSAYIPIGFHNGTNFFSAFVNKTQIQLRAQRIYWNSPFVITIQYTKTTD